MRVLDKNIKTDKTQPLQLIIMMVLFLGLLSFIVFFRPVLLDAQGIEEKDHLNDKEDSLITISVITAGDAMAHMPQITAAYNQSTKSYDFDTVFSFIAPIVKKYDLAIVNYETTAAGPPYKGYPQFCAPDALVTAVNNAGFNFYVHANNHAVDRGKSGIYRTIKIFDEHSIEHTGVFINDSARAAQYPFIKDIEGIKIAILNYTYGTNGLKTTGGTIVNMIDTSVIKEDIQTAKDSAADIILACMHWGAEYIRLPDAYQKNVADFLINNEVAVIIGSHPHVIQPITFEKREKDDIQDSTLVIWSLGNLISNQQRHYTDGGLLAGFDIEKNRNNNEVTIKNVHYYPVWVYRTPTPYQYYILPTSKYDDYIKKFNMSSQKQTLFKRFKDETHEHLNKHNSFNIKESFTK